jgi:hypothetical protein
MSRKIFKKGLCTKHNQHQAVVKRNPLLHISNKGPIWATIKKDRKAKTLLKHAISRGTRPTVFSKFKTHKNQAKEHLHKPIFFMLLMYLYDSVGKEVVNKVSNQINLKWHLTPQ